MKKFLSCFIVFVFFATSCVVVDAGGDQNTPDGENVYPSIELGADTEQEIVLEPDGGSEIIRFTSSQNWYVETPEDASWLQLSPVEGESGSRSIKVKATENLSGGMRRTEFKICSGTVSVMFSVIQDTYESTFELPQTEMNISADGGILRIPISTNQDFEVSSRQDWVIVTNPIGKRPEFIIVAVEPNLTSSARTSEIIVSSEKSEATIELTQDPVDARLGRWTEKSFASRSLAMRFTATWCGNCPQMSSALDSAKEQMNGALEIVSLHGSDSAYEYVGTGQLERKFGVTAYPTGIVDFRASIPNYSSSEATASLAVQVAQETKSAYTAQAGIAVDSYLSGTDLIVCVPIYFHQPDAYRVTVLLLEDDIAGDQFGAGSGYKHNDVVRKALTSVSGESVRTTSANTVCTQVYTTKVSADWNPDNLKVLVYVEKPYGNQQKVEKVANVKYGNLGDTYIDNCRAVNVGETADLELR